MPKRNLTDRTVKSLKPATRGSYDAMDQLVPGFGVRVSDTGRKTFIMIARFNSRNPTRRALGVYDGQNLAAARDKARAWLQSIRNGKDPAVEAERDRQAELRRQAHTFESVAEDFIRDKLGETNTGNYRERKGREVARDIRGVLIPHFGKRPIADITALDIRNWIITYRDRPYHGANLLGYARRIWNWAIDQHVYGLETSPCDRIRPGALLGERPPRHRVLTDAEVRAVWKAAETVGYPCGQFVQMLLLTGQRRTEVAAARWSEIDLDARRWIIPAHRMKAEAVHVVPLSDDAVALLESLPRFTNGDFVFSTSFGKRAPGGFSRWKNAIDDAMARELGSKPAPWVFHDLRRTVRTGLSAIPGISDLVRELVIGHTQTGLHRVYDLYAYEAEKRHALELWAERLRSIVTPKPANVVSMADARV